MYNRVGCQYLSSFDVKSKRESFPNTIYTQSFAQEQLEKCLIIIILLNNTKYT